METSAADVFVGAAFLAIVVVFGVSVVSLLSQISRTLHHAVTFETLRRSDPLAFERCLERYIETRPTRFKLEEFARVLYNGFAQESAPPTPCRIEDRPQFSDTEEEEHESTEARAAASENGLDDDAPHDG